ncbi:MAG TPA: TagF domain-containing protein [Thermoanaerobaculia bacterium]|nr:TagF domain-containing protein [Thermoanaerobaculia bacterium]
MSPSSERISLLGGLGRLLGSRRRRTLLLSFSAYGKLPVYKDFLRLGMSGGEAQAFRQWLDRGFSRFWEADEVCSAHHPIAGHGFVLGWSGAPGRLAGCLWGSHDQGELRRFPFALFVALPRGVGPLAELHVLAQLMPAAAALRLQVAGAAGAEEFYRQVRAATLTLRVESQGELLEQLRREAGEITVGSFAASLFGGPEDEAAARKGSALLAFLGRVRARAGAAAPPFACRLPVSPLLPALRQAEIWGVALGHGSAPLNCLLPVALAAREDDGVAAGVTAGVTAGMTAGMALFARDLRPEDVLVLHPDPPHYEHAEDLRRDVPRLPDHPPADRSLVDELLARPLAALLDPGVLASLGG